MLLQQHHWWCRELSDAAIGLKAQDVETNKVIELAKKVLRCTAAASHASRHALFLAGFFMLKPGAACAESCFEFGI